MPLHQINESELSQESKDFITKFQKIDQSKYNQLSNKVKIQKTPLTINQAKYIMR